MARPAGLEPATPGLAYHYCFHSHRKITGVCGLDYLFTVSGAARIVSTEPHDVQPKTSRFSSRTFSRTLPSASNSRYQRPVSAARIQANSINLSLQVPWAECLRVDHRFPRDCHQLDLLRFPRYGAVHCSSSVSHHRLLTQRPVLYPVELRAHTQLITSVCLRFSPQSSLNQA